jgi:ribosomal protein S16
MVHRCEDGDGDLNSGKDGNKEISIKSDRVKYWFSVGAQPTDTVRGLYRAGLMKPPTQP